MTALIVIIIIVVVAVVAAAVIGWRYRLRRRFGPEYDRAVAEHSGVLRAEAELSGRQRRVRKLDIRPLSDDARRRYTADWAVVQERFVDAPQTAVTQAYNLVTTVMTERGYPNADDEQATADLSVDHARTVGHFRAARQITQQVSQNGADGDSDTEALRQALIHYRVLFSDLLGTPDDAEQPASVNGRAGWADEPAAARPAVADETAAQQRTWAAEPVEAEPLEGEPYDSEPLEGEPYDSEPLAGEPYDSEPLRDETTESRQQ
jgi:hypothetical protein